MREILNLVEAAFPAGLTNGVATNIQTLHDLDPEHEEADQRLRLHHGPNGEPDGTYDALNRYTELSGRFTRGLIAGGLKKGKTTGFDARDIEHLKSVDGYISRAKPLEHDLVVYSGLGFLPEGDTFVSPAFLSTSIDPARAAAHANDRRRHRGADFDVIARFHLPAGYTGGRYLGRFSKYRGEAEFLLARGQTFSIADRHTVEVTDDGNVFTRYILDLVPVGS
jgi:hypothetical protein